jgi:hypothetical protein
MSKSCQYRYHNMYDDELVCPVCYSSGYIRPSQPKLSKLFKKFLVLIRLCIRSIQYAP